MPPTRCQRTRIFEGGFNGVVGEAITYGNRCTGATIGYARNPVVATSQRLEILLAYLKRQALHCGEIFKMLLWRNSSNPVFIRRKKSRNRETFQLVESYRKEGKVRQRVIIDLGGKDSVEGAIAVCERRIIDMSCIIERSQRFIGKFDSEPDRIKGHVYRSPAVLQARRYWLHRDTIDKFNKRIEQQRRRLARLSEVAEEVGIDAQALEAARKDQLELMRQAEDERQRHEVVLRKLLKSYL